MNRKDVDNIKALKKAIKLCCSLAPGDDASAEELETAASVIEMCEEMDSRLTRIAIKRMPRDVVPPYGTYGEWDHPNYNWKRRPREDEVEVVRLQKFARDPKNNLWQTYEACHKWLAVKGFYE